jgi:predicted dehydrogenase
MDHRKVRYAVVGAGNIAQVAVLPAFEHARESSELVAVVSGDRRKREVLRERYALQHVADYQELEKIVASARVDALYIATPSALHKDVAVWAGRHGVHVLCEKPLASSVRDAEEIALACDQGGAKLMVAYRLHFEEATLKALELVRSGKLGEPRVFESVFSHRVRSDDIRRDAALGGGAALDLGVYCINAARSLFGAEPILVHASARFENDVDDTTTAVLHFPGDRVAQFTVSNSCARVSSYRVVGTEGDLRVEPAYDYLDGLTHYLTIGEQSTKRSFSRRDQFAPELIYFSRCILEDRVPEPSAQEAINDLRVVEAILESANTGVSVPLTPRPPLRGPSMAQELEKPPVAQQTPLHAPGPSIK